MLLRSDLAAHAGRVPLVQSVEVPGGEVSPRSEQNLGDQRRSVEKRNRKSRRRRFQDPAEPWNPKCEKLFLSLTSAVFVDLVQRSFSGDFFSRWRGLAQRTGSCFLNGHSKFKSRYRLPMNISVVGGICFKKYDRI